MKSVAKAEPVPAGTREDIGWRQFPKFEEVLGSGEPEALLAKVEKTCRQLNEVIQAGAEADKARAKRAMTAYGRSLDLLHLLTEIRDKSAEQK
jgi:hypothetical protein